MSVPGYPWSEGDPLFASALNSAFLPLTGGTLGSTPFGQTMFTFSPMNPPDGDGALNITKVGGTAIGDDPQFRSYLLMDHNGADNPFHALFETNVTGNTGVWALTNLSSFTSNDTAGGHVGFYTQQVRGGVNAGGTKGTAGWCGVMELRSVTGLASSQDGILQTLELDLFANGADDHAPAFGRTILSLVLGQDNPSGSPVEASYGISFFMFQGASNGWFHDMIGAVAPFSRAVLNTTGATQMSGANAIWLKDGHTIALDAAAHVTLSSDGNNLKFGRLPANAINDAAAAAAGVPVDGLYRNGSVLMVRAV